MNKIDFSISFKLIHRLDMKITDKTSRVLHSTTGLSHRIGIDIVNGKAWNWY